MKTTTLAGKLLPLLLAVFAMGTRAQSTADPYVWLEDVDSPRSMDWVRKENDKTTGVLEKDPRYAGIFKDALALVEDKDRIPAPTQLDGAIYNFWQDSGHVRGIWRRTALDSYRTTSPDWKTVLDLDALATTEKANWFFAGAQCTQPDEQHCMLALSDGGEDASTVREFDLKQGGFVPDGFVLPHGKQSYDWQDDSTLVVAREWSAGDLTTSGYPFIVKLLKRGQPLTAATEVFRGTRSDVGVGPFSLYDGAGHHVTMIARNVTFFESENYLLSGGRAIRLAFPKKVQIVGLLDGRFILSVDEDWKPADTTFTKGSVLSLDLAAMTADPQHLKPTLIFTPGPRQSFAAASVTRSAMVLTMFDNVRSRAFIYRPAARGGWTHARVDFPENQTIGIADTTIHGDDAFLSVTGFLQPSSLWLVNAKADSKPVEVKTRPARFDASHDVVEQYEAKSSDGTEIPYFVVHPVNMKLDGNNPTILNAYGGFQVAMTPTYSAVNGKLWLERGGVFVLANIRGGGEFGPAWHEAGLKTHRQIIYDDFTAVARDLIARKITSPRRLGIKGGSNGGLLMGVEYTQHPELWNAVSIQVPLLDMLRYEKIAAGSSWVGEYGSVSNPEEAAFLAKISPYNNIHKGTTYPEALIWTTTKDDRVGPQHARKFAARLSEYGIPYLYYEVIEGGHGSGANLKEQARTNSLETMYFVRKLFD